MRNRKKFLISIMAALLSAVLVYSFYEVQSKQLMEEEHVRVVIPKQFITAGQTITNDMLEWYFIPKSAFQADMIQSMEEIVGKDTVMPLGKGEIVLNWKVDWHYLFPDRNEATFQIPRDYIKSVSNGIRAGDAVYIYVSSENTPSFKLFDYPVMVASVKTGNNMEVDNMEQSHLMALADNNLEQMYASRREANGMIDFINLNLSEEEWLIIDEWCREQQAKLVIAFSTWSEAKQESDHNE